MKIGDNNNCNYLMQMCHTWIGLPIKLLLSNIRDLLNLWMVSNNVHLLGNKWMKGKETADMSHETCGTNRDCKNLADFMKAVKKHDTTPLRTNGCVVSNVQHSDLEKFTTHHTVVDCLGNDACDLGPGTGGPCFFLIRSKVSQMLPCEPYNSEFSSVD